MLNKTLTSRVLSLILVLAVVLLAQTSWYDPISKQLMFLPSSGGTGTSAVTCTLTNVSSIDCTHSLGTTSPAVWCVDSAGNYLGGSGTTSAIGIVALSSSATRITLSGL